MNQTVETVWIFPLPEALWLRNCSSGSTASGTSRHSEAEEARQEYEDRYGGASIRLLEYLGDNLFAFPLRGESQFEVRTETPTSSFPYEFGTIGYTFGMMRRAVPNL